MKVIVNFGEKKVVVPCGTNGDISIRELIHLATTKYCKLSYNHIPNLNSEQVQLRLNNGAVVDPDDRVCDVVDDREEIFAVIESHHPTTILNSNGELSSSLTSSNLSTSLSEHERPIIPSNNRHEVVVTDADLRTRSLRIKAESNPPHQSSSDKHGMYNIHIDEKTGDKTFYISLPKENSPLGIHVIPYNSNENEVNGLFLQNIESDGRIKRQGLLEINDRIIEINRINIEKCSFEKAQLVFRNALLESELELKIVRNMKKPSTPFFLNELNQNTKRLGKIIKITLIKGNDGLGFKLASRDNPTGIANPIYVKTIFPKGAAIEDGRLRNGDRLLTVNSIDVTQMSLQEAVGLLRETRIGDTVHLCISRQHDGSLPKDLITDEVKTQIMTFDIPLRDTSSAGLGITLKGKTSIVDGQSIDLGIFVKSILTGGAAYRDNRLRSNDQILIINDSSLVNLSNLEAAEILHDAVRKEIQPGYIKITISRVFNDENDINSKNVKETELLPSLLTQHNDENELDLTNFVPPMIRRTPINEKREIKDENMNTNPFDRETPFRQSISEKRRLTQQPNNQAVQWKQQSFHDNRTNSERRQPSRTIIDTSTNLIRSSSYESIHRPIENDNKKRDIKSRNRACNDSFRHAVDKSYGRNNHDDSTNGEKTNKSEKQKFRFSNLFTTKSKRKENQEEKSITKSTIIHPQLSSHDNHHPTFYPPPPPPFRTQQETKPEGYQPYRFNSNQIIDYLPPTHHESQVIHGTSSLSINLQKPTHPPIPKQFLQPNINGTRSLKQHQPTSRPTFQNFPIHTSQQINRTGYTSTKSQVYFQFQNPANV